VTDEPPLFERAALIGLGLIGSSLAWAMKRDGVAREIVGYARSPETRATALRLGFLDAACETAAEAARGADLVVLCVPSAPWRRWRRRSAPA